MRTCLVIYFMSSLNCCRLSSCILKCRSAVSHDTFSSLADKSIMILCSCHDMFLSTFEDIILFSYVFDPIALEKPSVFWLRSKSRGFWFVNQDFVFFVVISFSQLRQFFFLLFTSLIQFFLKLLQFNG